MRQGLLLRERLDVTCPDSIGLGPVDDGGPRQTERALGGGDGVPQRAARVTCVVGRRIYVVKSERRFGRGECAADERLIERVGASASLAIAEAGACPGLERQRIGGHLAAGGGGKGECGAVSRAIAPWQPVPYAWTLRRKERSWRTR